MAAALSGAFGKQIAIVLDGVENGEIVRAQSMLERAGLSVHYITTSERPLASLGPQQRSARRASGSSYDGLLLLGGTDRDEFDGALLDFVRRFFRERRPIAAHYRAAALLAASGEVDGYNATSDPLHRTLLEGAGADWVDLPLIVDNTLITTRGPEELEAAIEKLIELLNAPEPEGDRVEPAIIGTVGHDLTSTQ